MYDFILELIQYVVLQSHLASLSKDVCLAEPQKLHAILNP